MKTQVFAVSLQGKVQRRGGVIYVLATGFGEAEAVVREHYPDKKILAIHTYGVPIQARAEAK
ncbi:MAG: hypothetical protein QN130_12315 [Armatimonadota bacterium]|nr:hypothetical protein [Armatimonadota bacterium]